MKTYLAKVIKKLKSQRKEYIKKNQTYVSLRGELLDDAVKYTK